MVQSEDNVTKDEVKEDQVAEGEIKEDEIKEDQDIKTPKSAVWSGYLGLISLWMSWSWVNSEVRILESCTMHFQDLSF